jgi:hypothetical protein
MLLRVSSALSAGCIPTARSACPAVPGAAVQRLYSEMELFLQQQTNRNEEGHGNDEPEPLDSCHNRNGAQVAGHDHDHCENTTHRGIVSITEAAHAPTMLCNPCLETGKKGEFVSAATKSRSNFIPGWGFQHLRRMFWQAKQIFPGRIPYPYAAFRATIAACLPYTNWPARLCKQIFPYPSTSPPQPSRLHPIFFDAFHGCQWLCGVQTGWTPCQEPSGAGMGTGVRR